MAPKVKITERDRVIVLMGPSGAGKSTFIKHAIGQGNYQPTPTLVPDLSFIRIVRCNHPVDEKPVVFVEPPSFEEEPKSKIPKLIADWFVGVLPKHVPMSVIVYLHRISDITVPKSPLENLQMFADIYGMSDLPRVVVGTTMWSEVNAEKAAPREEQLKDAWRDMIDNGYTIERFGDSRDSAWKMIDNAHFRKGAPRANVVIFGQAGAGKSSLVNMIVGRDVAKTSSSNEGCTSKSTPYETDDPSLPAITLWDTAGLNEGPNGTVTAGDAIKNILKLTLALERKGGLSLLVYCVRGRITETTIKNYEMFKTFCEGKVPIALVVTGLELSDDKDKWWKDNSNGYTRAGLSFDDHACVVTTKGRPGKNGHYVYEDDYAESTRVVWGMITRARLVTPWTKKPEHWLAVAATALGRIFGKTPMVSEVSIHLYEGLTANGFTPAKAEKLVRKAYRGFVAPKSPRSDM